MDTLEPIARMMRHGECRPVLVSPDVARVLLRADNATIAAMVDCGELRWVWNIATRTTGSRMLRFWLGELMAPQLHREAKTEKVLDALIGYGTQPRLHAGTVGRILSVARQTVYRLCDAGELEGHFECHTWWVTRSSFRQFLNRRLE